MDSGRIRQLKMHFMFVARSICPEFHVTEEQKPVINAIFRWCIMADGPLNPHKGLWLHGEIGSGKTTMLQIVKQFCRNIRPALTGKPYSFRISNAIEVCGEFSTHGYDGIDTYITSRQQAFDEIGSESIPSSHYGSVLNVFQYILQRRYDNRHNSFTHVTTNHTVDQISTLYDPRIFDRCREMFNFVKYNGDSFRKPKETSI